MDALLVSRHFGQRCVPLLNAVARAMVSYHIHPTSYVRLHVSPKERGYRVVPYRIAFPMVPRSLPQQWPTGSFVG